MDSCTLAAQASPCVMDSCTLAAQASPSLSMLSSALWYDGLARWLEDRSGAFSPASPTMLKDDLPSLSTSSAADEIGCSPPSGTLGTLGVSSTLAVCVGLAPVSSTSSSASA